MLYRSGSDDLRKGRRGFSFCPRSESCKRALSCQSSDGYWFLAHRLFRPPAQRAWSALSSVCFDRSEYSLAPAHSFSLSLSLFSSLLSGRDSAGYPWTCVYARLKPSSLLVLLPVSRGDDASLHFTYSRRKGASEKTSPREMQPTIRYAHVVLPSLSLSLFSLCMNVSVCADSLSRAWLRIDPQLSRSRKGFNGQQSTTRYPRRLCPPYPCT